MPGDQAGRLPELREADAPAEIRAIYDDIRDATGIPQVNLIVRHLALWPEVLSWVWETLAPAYRSGAVAAAVERLEAGLAPPEQPPLAEALAGAPEAAELGRVLDFYNRGNASNLIGLTAFLQVVEGGGPAGPPATPRPAAPPAPRRLPALGPVPPLPRRDEIAPEIVALIDALSRRQGSAALGVTPSLYLHLARWPDAVRRACDMLDPMLGTPEWRGRVDRVIATARTLAGELAPALRPPVPAPDDGLLRPRLETVRQFVETPIPQMVLIGHLLAGRRTSG